MPLPKTNEPPIMHTYFFEFLFRHMIRMPEPTWDTSE